MDWLSVGLNVIVYGVAIVVCIVTYSKVDKK